MPFDLTQSVTGQLSNVQGTPAYLHDRSAGSVATWYVTAGSEWMVYFSREAGLDASDAAFTAFLRDTVGLSLGVAAGYQRVAINGRGNTVSAHFSSRAATITNALGVRAMFCVLMYTAAIASPSGNWGAVGFFFGADGVAALMGATTAAELPVPTSTGSVGSWEILTHAGARAGGSAGYAAMTRASTTAEEPDEVDEPDVPEVVQPPVAMPEEVEEPEDVVETIVSPGGVGGGTPNPPQIILTGGAGVALVPISGAGTLARFVVTLPGFARTATGFSFTNNSVARAAWAVTKAALAGLGLTQLVDLIDELANDAVLLFRLGGGGTDYSVGDMIGNASVTKVWEANDVPFLALSDGRLGARKSTGMWRFWRPRRPIVLYSDGAKDLKTGMRAGKALIKQAREMRKLSNALLGTTKEKRKSPTPYHHHEQGTTIRNIEVT